ncbi:crossover junction endonuclease EME1 [Palaemon carinicauda]|uniref:crossover junction endonuclease EME1 n=1 Tax=Palaemon carinicauda TaxID=392227 RepID=UPI0035B5E767
MSQTFHTLSSSDENSIDSLPDLQTRVLNKLHNSQTSLTVHTLSSSDEDDEKCGNGYISEGKVSIKVDADDDRTVLPYSTKAQPSLLKPVKNPLRQGEKRDGVDDIQEDLTDIQNFTLLSGANETTDAFKEDLPDIQNFTLLSKGLYNEDEDIKMVVSPTVSKRKLKADEVREEKEAKRKEREALRKQRALEKAEAKAQREAERTSRKAMKPGECLKYIKVQLDRHLLELPVGSQVLSHLQSADLRYEVVDSVVPCVASFTRIDPLTLQETLAEDAVIIVPLKDFITLVERQVFYNGVAGLCEKCKEWKSALSVPRITLVVAGVQIYLRGRKTNNQQDFRAAVLGEAAQPKRKKKKQDSSGIESNVNRVDIETALVMAQLECGVNHRLISDAEKVATFICQVAKSLAEAPYKREKEDSTFSWFAEGSNINTVKVDKTGVGLSKLWRQQLQQFNNVGTEVAQAIVREYPSPQALVQAYRHSTSEKEASLLLAHIPVRRGVGPLESTRRIGPELSKKIHLFFTCRDPNVNLGQKT